MANKEFKVGDIVNLRSGSPRLTVIAVGSSPREITVGWFVSGAYAEAQVPKEVLAHYDGSSSI